MLSQILKTGGVMFNNIKDVGAHLRKRERKMIKKANNLQCISTVDVAKLLIRAKRTRRAANDAIYLA